MAMPSFLDTSSGIHPARVAILFFLSASRHLRGLRGAGLQPGPATPCSTRTTSESWQKGELRWRGQLTDLAIILLCLGPPSSLTCSARRLGERIQCAIPQRTGSNQNSWAQRDVD